MSDFDIAIFKVANHEATPVTPPLTPSLEDRYILLVAQNRERPHSVNDWQTSDTLFGLQEKAKMLNLGLVWEEVERQVSKTGFYKRRPMPRQDIGASDRPK